MNKNFCNYATGLAFRVELTKAQVKALITVASPRNSVMQLQLIQPKSYDTLVHKGLIERTEKEFILTKPGKLVFKLLEEAGLVNRDNHQLLTVRTVRELHQELQHMS